MPNITTNHAITYTNPTNLLNIITTTGFENEYKCKNAFQRLLDQTPPLTI